MRQARLTLSAALAGVLSGALAVVPAPPAAGADEVRSLVTVVTSAEPRTQLMAMVLSTQAVAQGASLHMLLCGPGGDIALRDAPESATAPQPPQDMSPQGMMAALIEGGATVEVCAIYLPGLGADASALIDRVGVATPDEMAAAMLAEGTRVWSF